ncbi:hypothetical protein [Parafrankia sp. FMc2]|uniref:hypothetical protein n=1 Tax=Parafrankia sp. FMc2 TaxID=3233196 RepID=UPI0034D6AC96
MNQTAPTDPAEPLAATDTATRVHLLAVPRHVTLRAERQPDAYGSGHQYEITGHYAQGEPAFRPQVVSDSAADNAEQALRVQLLRFRERGW